MQMSFAESGSSLPAWAQRANEPLVPSLDLAAVKKSVNADLKEVRRATEALTKLAAAARKGAAPGGKGFGAQVLEVRSAAMDRARTTGRTLREAQALAEDGSSEQRALTALREEYNATLGRFRQQVEATSHLVEPVRPAQPDLESGGGGGGGGGGVRQACGGATGAALASLPTDDAADAAAREQQQIQQQQMQQVETNEAVIADREQGINHLNRSVQEVAEIFQDLALLVNEQGAQIDNIQTNIESAATSTEKGVRELARASRHQRRTRSRMCVIFACVLVVIILLVVVLKFGLHKLNR